MSSRFAFRETALSGLLVVDRLPVGDSRGFLERMFCEDDLAGPLAGRRITQINRTLTSNKGVVRGMHMQLAPHAEIKIVSCLRGEIFDVAVDVRQGSPTFLQWHGEILSADNHRSLFIPEGFAHGFQTLTESCELMYFHTHSYTAGAEFALNATDPLVDIQWPLAIAERSQRDVSHPYMNQTFSGVAPQ